MEFDWAINEKKEIDDKLPEEFGYHFAKYSATTNIVAMCKCKDEESWSQQAACENDGLPGKLVAHGFPRAKNLGPR